MIEISQKQVQQISYHSAALTFHIILSERNVRIICIYSNSTGLTGQESLYIPLPVSSKDEENSAWAVSTRYAVSSAPAVS